MFFFQALQNISYDQNTANLGHIDQYFNLFVILYINPCSKSWTWALRNVVGINFTWLGKYFCSNQIHDELFRLRKEYPDLVKLVNLGKSYEKQDMLGIEVRCSQKKWKLRSIDERIQKIRYQKGKLNVIN